MSDAQGFSEEGLRKIAEQKINFRYSVKIHIVAYILVNLLLVIINVLTINFNITLQNLWVLYPILGWFCGLSIHWVSYVLYAKGVYPMAKRGVIFHITAYLSVLLLLVVSNLITTPTYLWVFFPALFWGIGVVAHIVVYMIYFKEKITDKGETKSKKEQAIEKEMQKMRKRMEKQNK
jgi:hypothetical protein